MRNLLSIITLTLLSGCGTSGAVVTGASRVWGWVMPAPEVTDLPIPSTADDLSIFIYGGGVMFLAGVLAFAYLPNKKHGTVMMVGGAASALAGHGISEYAHWVIGSAIGCSFAYGIWTLAYSLGSKVGTLESDLKHEEEENG